MIRKKPASDLIRRRSRFSEKIMLKQNAREEWRSEEKSFRSGIGADSHSASGWFSGRARSKAGNARQAASIATILGNLSSGTFKRRALLTCGTRQISAIVTSPPQQ